MKKIFNYTARILAVIFIVFAISVLLFLFLPFETTQDFLDKEISYDIPFIVIKGNKETAMKQLYISACCKPDVFWFEDDFTISFPTSNCQIVVLNKKYNDYKERKIWLDNEMDSVLSEIITDDMTDYEKILVINNWICENFEYDKTDAENKQDAYSAFVDRKTVCNGYAKTFSYMLSRAGIDSELIIGKCTGRNNLIQQHAWNAIVIDGNKYFFDITWNDTGNTDKWLFMDSEEFSQRHILDEYCIFVPAIKENEEL